MTHRLGNVVRLVGGSGFPLDDQGVTEGQFPFFKVGSLNADANRREATVSDNYVSNETRLRLRAEIVPAGSVLLPKIGAALFRNTRRIAGVDCLIDNNLLALVPQGIDSRYLSYLMQTVDSKALANPGPIPTLNEYGLRSLEVPISNVSTQQRIAEYLDTETARIDSLIEKKETLLALLERRWEATVFSAVSRGLSNAPTSPINLEWVERIPSHWKIRRLGSLFTTTLGKMLSPAADSGEQFPYLRNVNVQWDRIDLSDLAEMHFSQSERQRLNLQTGDLLVCEGGEVGRAAVWSSPIADCYFQKAVHRVRPRLADSTRFLMYLLMAASKMGVFTEEGNTSTIVHLTGEQLRSHRLPFPPPGEQNEIVSYLDNEGRRIKQLSDHLSAQVELLKEHRQAILSGLTGPAEHS